MKKGDNMTKNTNDPFGESMKKQERIVDKLKNQDDSLLKLRELFSILGLDIDFNHAKKTAILKQNGTEIPMKYNGDHGYFLKDGSKLVAFEYKEFSLLYHYGVRMEVVIVDENNHMQVTTFTQGDTLGGNESPKFSISDFQNNQLNKIYTDGHFLEVSRGNVLDLGSAEILSSWGVSLPHKFRLNTDYTTMGFGAYMDLNGIDPKGEREYDYIPTISLETIKKGIGTTKRMLVSGNTAGYQELKYNIIPTKFTRSSILPYSMYVGMRTIVDPANRRFNLNDFAYEQALLELIQSPEALETFRSVSKFFNTQQLAWFLEIYYGSLFRGIKFYQNGPEKKVEISPMLEKK